MRTISVNIYKFNELSDEVKQKVIDKWYENEDYPHISSDLTESIKAQLEHHNINYQNLEVLYSLSYSQGDGLCFVGNFTYKDIDYTIIPNNRYFYAKSVHIVNESDYTDFDTEFGQLYLQICKETEKEGYGILDYRMNFDEFNELCEANNYEFYEDGKMI
ncbi:MAG: hypothetical protein ACYDBX_02355 [Patescibacteria group bacterium]